MIRAEYESLGMGISNGLPIVHLLRSRLIQVKHRDFNVYITNLITLSHMMLLLYSDMENTSFIEISAGNIIDKHCSIIYNFLKKLS